MLVDRASLVQEQPGRTFALRVTAWIGSLITSAVTGLFYLSSRRHHWFTWASKQWPCQT